MNTTAAYAVDKSNYPIIRFHWHRNASGEELKGYLRDLTEIIAEQKRVTLLFDMPTSLNLKAEERLTTSRWLRDHEAEVTRYVRGTCFLTSSALIAMALRAIFIFAPPTVAWKITGSAAEADAWCRSIQEGRTPAMAS